MVSALPTGVVLPRPGVRVSSLWFEIWVWPGERKTTGVNDRSRTEGLAGEKEGRSQIEPKTDFVRQRGVRIPAPARRKKLDVIIIENLGNGIEARINVGTIKVAAVVGPSAAEGVLSVQVVVHAGSNVVPRSVASRVELKPQQIHSISNAVVIGSLRNPLDKLKHSGINRESRMVRKIQKILCHRRPGWLPGRPIQRLISKG